MKINIVKYNKLFLLITLVLMILSIAAVAIWKLKLGIDFTGGTIIEYKISQKPAQNEIEEKVKANQSIPKISKFSISNDTYTLYFEPLSEDTRKLVDDAILKAYEGSSRVSIETISTGVGIEQSQKAFQAVAFASIGIIIFLTITFWSVPKPFSSIEFGISAVLALIHDAFVVLGVFALLGHIRGIEIDSLFITAILTVIGFSVHDTIVVFDRIRENLKISLSSDYRKVVNNSLVETLARSINLTVTAVLVLTSMFILGPSSLRWFIGALLVGMISGTYSSIFVASQLLILYQDMKIFLGKLKILSSIHAKLKLKK